MVNVRRQYHICMETIRTQIAAAVVIQSYVRMRLAKREADVRRGAIVTIQVGSC